MEKPYQNKFTWTIKNFSSFHYNTIYSDYFVVGGCKWRIEAYPKGDSDDNHLSLYVFVDDSALLPCGWRRNIKYRLTVVNQLREELSELREISTSKWVDQCNIYWGFQDMLPLTKLHAKDSGFLMNDELMVVAEVDVLEVIGKSDVLVEETTQVKSVNGLFERHLDTATNVKNQYDKKIIWTIKNFSSLQSVVLYSDHFVVGGCKWRLEVYPKGYNNNNHLSLYLNVADSELLHSEWRRHTYVRLTVVNQLREELSQVEEAPPWWFDQKFLNWGYLNMLPLTKLHSKDGGFLVNDEVKITVEVDVLELIGKSDVLEEKTTPVMETIDVSGFQVLPSQVIYANHLFEKYPNIVTNVKNEYLKTWFMNVLLNLIDTLEKLPEKISKNDLADAYVTLEHMTNAGFELDWLKNVLDLMENNEKADM